MLVPGSDCKPAEKRGVKMKFRYSKVPEIDLWIKGYSKKKIDTVHFSITHFLVKCRKESLSNYPIGSFIKRGFLTNKVFKYHIKSAFSCPLILLLYIRNTSPQPPLPIIFPNMTKYFCIVLQQMPILAYP